MGGSASAVLEREQSSCQDAIGQAMVAPLGSGSDGPLACSWPVS